MAKKTTFWQECEKYDLSNEDGHKDLKKNNKKSITKLLFN